METTTAGSRRKAAIVGALTGLMGYGAIQYRRNNRRAAVAALRDAVEPPSLPDPTDATAILPADDEAHASGHRHLAPPQRSRRPITPRRAPRRADQHGHPGRFF
ncbi:MAG: hypothetical protein U0Q22_01845 [Acidimicrobiales bacterium]